MKSIILDSGPIISLTTNNLLWILDILKQKFAGKFCIPQAVKEEIIDNPLNTKKFKFEALQVLNITNQKVIEVVGSSEIKDLANRLMDISNNIFKARDSWMHLFHYAEMEVLAAAIVMKADAIVIDERMTRKIIEDPISIKHLLQKQFHSRVHVDKKNLHEFLSLVKGINVIRSVELAMIAYELGLLDKFLVDRPDARTLLVDSFLWGIKLRGCAVSVKEIQEMVELEAH